MYEITHIEFFEWMGINNSAFAIIMQNFSKIQWLIIEESHQTDIEAFARDAVGSATNNRQGI